MDDYIDILSELRSQFNCFDEEERPYYEALTSAIHGPFQRIGYWIKEKDRYLHWHCSECRYVISGPHREFHYCPKCGTKMEGDR